MKYEKPVVLFVTAALTSVLDPSNKQEIEAVDSKPEACSQAAYAADE